MKSARRTICVAVAAGCLMIVAATAAGATSGANAVTISVASLIPGSSAAAVQQFNTQVSQFDLHLIVSDGYDEAGAPIEADHIIGDLLSRAAMPLLQIVYAGLKAYEARRSRML